MCPSLIAFDANSLYPTVMKSIEEFPDIYNSEKIDNTQISLDDIQS